MSNRDESCMDTELIECHLCGLVLNSLNLWVVGESEEAITICEGCYNAKYNDGRYEEE